MASPRRDPSPLDSLSCSWIVTLSYLLGARRRVASRFVSYVGRCSWRFPVESRCPECSPNPAPGGVCGHTGCTKSGIRTGSIFALILVTDEFYGRVTTRSVTRGRTATKTNRDKRPASRWLRWSRNNFPDQGTIVIESLCKNFLSVAARVGRRPSICSVGQSTIVHQNGVSMFAGKSLPVGKFR